jgi:hypothetical protein
MTPDHVSPREGVSYLRLAAYADGELDTASRQALEQWLACCPDAEEVLRDQQRFSPGNVEFWSQVAVPEPSAAAWYRVLRTLADRLGCRPEFSAAAGTNLHPRTNSAIRKLVAGLVAAAAAGLMISLGLWGIRSQQTPTDSPKLPAHALESVVGTPRDSRSTTATGPAALPRPAEPATAMAVLPMATAEDVWIESVCGKTTAILPGLELPGIDNFTLATRTDVLLVPFQPETKSGHRAVLTGDGASPIVIVAVLDPANSER